MAYSVGGGSIVWEEDGDFNDARKNIYREKNLKEILETLDRNAYSFYDYVMEHENALFVDYLYEILDTMFDSVERGLRKEGVIPGKLQLPRVAKQMYSRPSICRAEAKRNLDFEQLRLCCSRRKRFRKRTIVTGQTCGFPTSPACRFVLLHKQLVSEKPAHQSPYRR